MTCAIAAPEGLRGQAASDLPQDKSHPESVTEFTQQDYDKFMRGYRSQHEEMSMWLDDTDIEGG